MPSSLLSALTVLMLLASNVFMSPAQLKTMQEVITLVVFAGRFGFCI